METINQISPASAITQWLTMLSRTCRGNGIPDGYHYAGIGDFLLQHGTWYKPKGLPRGIRRGELRNCFTNALTLGRSREYTYVEGYAIPNIENLHFPVHHAWNLDRNGNVIDNTWRKTGLAYFGVAFPLEVAFEALYHCDNTVLDNPETHFELFRKPFEVTSGH
jgi:hypothetical protein